MPKKVREVLEEFGDNIVQKIQLGRTPVQAFLTSFLNIVSKGRFKKKKVELGYDEIYHSYLLITINNEKESLILPRSSDENILVYKLEKAQRIRLVEPDYNTEFLDTFDIPLTPNKTYTLNRLITTASNVDKHFYKYDAANNNMCQTFVENIVDINGLTLNIIDNETKLALKPQDAKTLVATLGSRSDIVKSITDLGGSIDKLVHDDIIRWKIPSIKEFVLYGHMHVKKTDDTGGGNNEEILGNNDGSVVIINGTMDTIVENTDDIYNAVIALETEEENENRRKKIVIIVCSILGSIVLISIIVGVGYFIWRKRKNKLMKEGITNDIIKKTESDSSSISESQ